MTTNESNILRDITGNRRYAVIEVNGKIKIDLVAQDLMQLWAEAKTLSISVDEIDEMEKLIKAKPADYLELPIYHDRISHFLTTKEEMTYFKDKPLTTLLINEFLNVGPLNRSTANEIRKSMRLFGYISKQSKQGGARISIWAKS